MRLSERLSELVGHQVSVTSPAEIGEEHTVTGVLREVGENYLMITDWDEIAGFTLPGERVIPIMPGVSVIHGDDCRRCRSAPPG